MQDEIASLLDFVMSVLRAFGFDEFTANLSTKDPDKYVGDDAIWEKATEALRAALVKYGLPYKVKEGDAAFYGPKIDIDVRDAIGRTWQLSTIQARLQPPRAVRPRVRRRRQRPPSADHVAPRPVRLAGAVLRCAARALRRGVPDVDGAGAGAGAARRRGPPSARRTGRRALGGRRFPCRHRRRQRSTREANPHRQAGEASLRVGGRRRRRCRRNTSGSTRVAATSNAACRSRSSSAGCTPRSTRNSPSPRARSSRLRHRQHQIVVEDRRDRR